MSEEHKRFAEIFIYRQGAAKVEESCDIEALPELIADPSNVIWVDIRGENPDDIPTIKDILLNVFNFHYLTVEDCLETRNSPKIEAFPDYFYFIVHGVKPDETSPTNFVTK